MNRPYAHVLTLLLALQSAAAGAAQTRPPYPVRPVRLIVATVPGGGTDAIARILGSRLSELLGQPFVIDNRGGAGGIIGTETVARAAPDGYTLLMGFIASLAMNPALVRTPYDPNTDFTPVSLVAEAQYVVTIHPSVPARSLKELVAYAKANPGRINYASAGNGTPVHLAAELFKSVAQINLVHIPYKGGGPAAAALLSGEAQLIFGSVTATMPQITGGKLIALAVTGRSRLPSAPELATVAELGYPGFEVTSWYGVLGPARMPAAIVATLNRAVLSALRIPEVREQMARQGMDAIASTPAAFAAHLQRETAKWARVTRQAGIKAD